MGTNDRRKPIVELDKPGGKVIKYWESAKKASEAYNISQVMISYNVTGKLKQANKHYFRFANPREIEQYTNIKNSLETPITVATPVVAENTIQIEPGEIIPEVVKRNENHNDTLTPFEQLLENSKKKLKDNSK